MKWIIGTAAALVLLGTLLYRERGDERVIDIAAAPADVWRVLMDFGAYPEWNPMVRRISGDPVPDATLVVDVENGGSSVSFRPTVLDVVPEREFRWIGRFLAPRVVDGEHYFLLEPVAGGTRFTQGERFRGLAVRFAGSTIDVGEGFEASNAALRDRVLATIAE